jgi:AraC-like DNA-binding protein
MGRRKLLAGLGAVSGLVAPRSRRLPRLDAERWATTLQLPADARERVAQDFERLHTYSTSSADGPEGEAVLWHLTMATLHEVRRTASVAHPGEAQPPSADVARLESLRRLIERSFRDTRAVAEYAGALGCSVRTLDRTTQALAGCTTSAMIAERVLLEAKRQLAHTDVTLEVLAEQLGFSEATQLSKFFRRGTGETAGAFRRRYRDRPPPNAIATS